MRIGETPFARGRYYKVWEGQWTKGGREEAEVERVGLSLTTSILLTIWHVAGGLESPSNRVTREGT